MKRHFPLIAAFFLLRMTATVHARTEMSPEAAFVSQMGTAMKIYCDLHNGTRVTNWDQVREVFDVDDVNKRMRGKPLSPLEDHYSFVTQQVAIPGYKGTEVI